jgi:alkylation response protein AidB-like acyl-CoA dehydrogenase
MSPGRIMNRVSHVQFAAQQADGATLIARAQGSHGLIEAAAPRIESGRALTDDVLAGLHDAGLFKMLLPRSCGGAETDPATFMQIIEALATADASTAWCVSQASGVSMGAAYLKPPVAREIFGGPRSVLANGTASTKVKAIPVAGGYRVTGLWRFASGYKHCDWLGGHCILCDAEGTPRLAADGKTPLERTLLFPKERATFTDVWQVIGLKGTGSDSYAVDNLFVPEDFTYTRESPAERRENGPLYRFTTFNIFGIGFSAVALGIARALLKSFTELAKQKVPYLTSTTLRDNAAVQSQVGIAQARLEAARALLLEKIADLWATATRGESFSRDQQVALRMASTHATHQAREVANFAYGAAGATAIFAANPFERRFRDIHTVAQQVQAGAANFELVGQHLLGLEAKSRLL